MSPLGYKYTAESKAKMSVAQRKRFEDPEERAKMAAVSRRRFADPAEREKHSAAALCRELSPMWQGDDINYEAAHYRHGKVLPKVCAHADETCSGRLEAAFRHDTPPEFVKMDPSSGRPYSTRAEDYMRMCRSHHMRYDGRAT